MRILFATDHSDPAAAAVEYLGAMRFAPPIELEIVTVVASVPYVDAAGVGAPIDFTSVLDADIASAEENIAEFMPTLEDRFGAIKSHVLVGPPGAQIAKLADDQNFDLVVLGAVGHSAIGRVLLGSVSDYVANHTQASVLVVRPESEVAQPDRVLLAAASSECDDRMVDSLRMLQLPSSTEIRLVHVMQTITLYRQDIRERASGQWQAARCAAEQHGSTLQSAIEELGFTTKFALIESPHIGDSLVTHAEQENCDLVITGDQRRGAISRLFLGSTSRYVLRHAPCSVMIARARKTTK